MRALLLLALIPAAAHADRDDCVRGGGKWIDEETGTGCLRGGQRVGSWEIRSPTGQLVRRQHYDGGVLDGPTIAFHEETCEIAEKGDYQRGKLHGPWAAWSASGQRQSEGSYTAGSREGVWKFYTANVAVMEGPMVNDAANGLFTERFTTGVTWRTAEIRDGQRTTPEAKACAARGGSFEIDHRAREEGCLVDDQREGVWLGYAGDGKLAWRSEYVKNREHGERVDYHPGGQILRRGRYVEGVPDGLHEFRDAAGALYGASTITSGTGAWKAFFPDGRVAEEGAYKNGQQDGTWRTFHRKGALADETTYKAGMRDGPYRTHYLTGELEVSGWFRADRRAGTWTTRYTNGNVAWTGNYDSGGLATGFFYFGNYNGTAAAFGQMVTDRRHGTWTLFHDDGTLQGVGTYQYGRKHGPWFEWWRSGKFWRIVHYVNDQEDSEHARACVAGGGEWISDDTERAVGCQVCRSAKEDDHGPVDQLKIGVWTWWHANAATEMEAPGFTPGAGSEMEAPGFTPGAGIEKQGAFVQGQRDGRWQWWFDNGQLMLETTYVAGKEQGPARGYFRDGRRRFEGSYIDGGEDGEWTTFHADGSVASQGRFAAGNKIGRWTYRYPGGAVKEEGDYTDGAPSGAWTSYHANGTRASHGAYVAGKRDGVWTFWRPDGSPWRTERFAAGKQAR